MSDTTNSVRWYDGAIMPSRSQITLDPGLDRKAKKRASELGLSFAEYVRRLITLDLADDTTSDRLAALNGIGDSGGSDIARQKDAYLDAAFGN